MQELKTAVEADLFALENLGKKDRIALKTTQVWHAYQEKFHLDELCIIKFSLHFINGIQNSPNEIQKDTKDLYGHLVDIRNQLAKAASRLS